MRKQILTLFLSCFILSFNYAQQKIGINFNSSVDRDFSNIFGNKYALGISYETIEFRRLSFKGNVNIDFYHVEPKQGGIIQPCFSLSPYYHLYVEDVKQNLISISPQLNINMLKIGKAGKLYISFAPEIRFLYKNIIKYYGEEIPHKLETHWKPFISVFSGIGYSYKCKNKIVLYAEPYFGFPIFNNITYRYSIGIRTGISYIIVKD